MTSLTLVTGAHGFIGRHVARALAARGHHVIGLGHGDFEPAERRAWGLAEWLSGDVTPENLTAIGAPRYIVHCASGGSVASSISHPYEDFQRAVATTVAIGEFIRTCAPDARLVLPSSAAVYGAAEGLPIAPSAPLRPRSPYGVHKVMAEDVVRSYCARYGLCAAIVRLFSVYGAGLRKQLLWDACVKFSGRDNRFFGTGNEIRDWLHVEDAAELLIAASEHASPNCPTVNGGTGEAVRNADVLAILAARFGAAAPAFSGVARPGDPVAYVADIAGAQAWGWAPRRRWREEIGAYARWFREDAR